MSELNTMVLQISQIHYPLAALGPGRRLGIWVQGCTLECPGCMSRHTWDPRGGQAMPLQDVLSAWAVALDDGANGLTVSGGEPLEQPALEPFLTAAARLRDKYQPEADILLYTGFTEREARRQAPGVLAATDAVITGRFVQRRPTALIWRGSANQRLVPLTGLGQRRYSAFVDHVAQRPPVQVSITTDGDLQVLGVPRVGDLQRLRALAQERGLSLADASWDDLSEEEKA